MCRALVRRRLRSEDRRARQCCGEGSQRRSAAEGRAMNEEDFAVHNYDASGSRPNGGKGSSTRFTIKRFEDIKPSTLPNYLVHGLLPREGLATIRGPPKSGKSFVA